MKFEVLREHIGDKFYKTGDVREVDQMSVVHLVRNGVLRPIPEEASLSVELVPLESPVPSAAVTTVATDFVGSISVDKVEMVETRSFAADEIVATGSDLLSAEPVTQVIGAVDSTTEAVAEKAENAVVL
ncbi:hypothetical protein G3A39_43035, partial [Paraburkholderia aspalathi]|nr:hypothetical protein [Paraburkholderia aspalathi]